MSSLMLPRIARPVPGVLPGFYARPVYAVDSPGHSVGSVVLVARLPPWLGSGMASEKAHLWQTKDRIRTDLGEVEVTIKPSAGGLDAASFTGPAEYSTDAQLHQLVYSDGSTQIFRHQKGSRGKLVTGRLQPRTKPKGTEA